MTDNIQAAHPPRFGLNSNAPLVRFWRWWTEELLALLPQWLRQSGVSAANSLLIAVSAHDIILYRWQQGGALAEEGRIDLQPGDPSANGIALQGLFAKTHRKGENIALLLTHSQFLAKRIELPLAAQENLRQVLSFEMDRHTPFKAEQVYFGYRTLLQDNSRNRITLNLIVAPRSSVDGPVELLSRWGVPVKAAFVADAENGADNAVNLMPDVHRTTEFSPNRKLNLYLFLLTLALAMIAIIIPIWQEREASIELIPKVESAKQQATIIENARHEEEKLATEYNFMLDKKLATPPAIVVLDELSSLLPDDTWVQQFSLKGKQMEIQGETASSSKLIALIESSRIFHNSSFRSPLTKGSEPNSERYQLVAEVKPMTLAELKAWPTSAPPNNQPAQQVNDGDKEQPPQQSAAPQENPALSTPQTSANYPKYLQFLQRRKEAQMGGQEGHRNKHQGRNGDVPEQISPLPQPVAASAAVATPDATPDAAPNPAETEP